MVQFVECVQFLWNATLQLQVVLHYAAVTLCSWWNDMIVHVQFVECHSHYGFYYKLHNPQTEHEQL